MTQNKITLANLENCFNKAYEERMRYVGVKIKMDGFEEPEIIINPFENIKDKLTYYKTAYNEDLTLKAFNGIKIIGFTFGDRFEDIENDLLF